MILSMTGFGRSEGVFKEKKISIEIKSLNSKNFDLNVKTPLRYREKEFELRKLLQERLVRGKVDCYVNIELLDSETEAKINKNLISAYIRELKECASDGPDFEYLKMAIRLPEAIGNVNETLDEEELKFFNETFTTAIESFEEFRATEGQILHDELLKLIQSVEDNLKKVEQYEEERMATVKERYSKALQEFDNVDETRFYQEMAYITEKLDITEEKVRLSQHLSYYKEVMSNEKNNGKKLGFISQEMGREINTLGSKANHAEIQKLVVMMKDDLEKIKEQTLNIL